LLRPRSPLLLSPIGARPSHLSVNILRNSLFLLPEHLLLARGSSPSVQSDDLVGAAINVNLAFALLLRKVFNPSQPSLRHGVHVPIRILVLPRSVSAVLHLRAVWHALSVAGGFLGMVTFTLLARSDCWCFFAVSVPSS